MPGRVLRWGGHMTPGSQGVVMPFIDTRDGAKLYVKSWGEGPPVVLIHGWPLNADSWDVQALALAEAGFRAIAYDRRGFGRSDQTWTGYDYDSLADDLADVMAATGTSEGATIAGFSMGGGEVARYMSRHGGRGVAAAALVSSVVPGLLKSDENPDGVPASQFETMEAGLRADRAAFFGAWTKQFYGIGASAGAAIKDALGMKPAADALSAEMVEQTHRWAMMGGLWPTIASMRAFAMTDFREDLPAFTVPTLVVHGASDKIVPIEATAQRVATALPTARLVEYDGAPHGLGVTEATRLSADLIALARSAHRL